MLPIFIFIKKKKKKLLRISWILFITFRHDEDFEQNSVILLFIIEIKIM